MVAQHVVQRLTGIAVLPTLHTALIELVVQDAPGDASASPWEQIIPRMYAVLGGSDEGSIRPFAHAWMLLVAAMRRLDHAQDGDVPDHPLPTTETGAQYNLVFSYYLLATALLDELDTQRISPARLLRLRRVWADGMLAAASGQQHDLELGSSTQPALLSLDDYQRIAYAKSGSIFAVAFGGAATLATDDPAIIATCTFVGHVYGMLVQFVDDIDDVVTQQDTGMNLLRVYDAIRVTHNVEPPPVLLLRIGHMSIQRM